MVNKIIKIEKIETQNEENITHVSVSLNHGTLENNIVIIEFRGNDNKNSLERFREEKWEKGGHLVKYNPNFLVDQEKFKNEKELGWKYFPLEPILTSQREKINSEEIIYISALDYRVSMLCVPEKAKLAHDIRFIEQFKFKSDSEREIKRELSARNYGNYPIYIDSSREFYVFFSNNLAKKFECPCGYKYFVGKNNVLNLMERGQQCPNCKMALGNPNHEKKFPKYNNSTPSLKELFFIELAYRVSQGEKEILKTELGHEVEHAETMDNYYQRLLKEEKEARDLAEKAKEKLEVELAQEKEKTENLIRQLEAIQQEKRELLAKIEVKPK